MSVAEIKNAIIGKVLSIEDNQQLQDIFELISKKEKNILKPTTQRHLDKILTEDHNLLHRLAQ